MSPIAKKTSLGWCCLGPMKLFEKVRQTIAMELQLAFSGYCKCKKDLVNLIDPVENIDFEALDHYGIKVCDPAERFAVFITVTHMFKNSNGNHVVPIP